MSYLTSLLAFLAMVAEQRGDERRHEFCDRWEKKLKRIENAARRAAIGLGENPDRAVEPFDTSPSGRAAHKVGFALGSLGEWIDRQAARRG